MTSQLSLLLPPTETPVAAKKPVSTAFGGLRDPLAPVKEEGLVALDDALEFATLLLDAVPEGTVEPDLTGSALPVLDGNILPDEDGDTSLPSISIDGGEAAPSGSLLRPLSTVTESLLAPSTIEDTGPPSGTGAPVLSRLPQLLDNRAERLSLSDSGTAAPTLPIADTDVSVGTGSAVNGAGTSATLSDELIDAVQSQPANVAAVASAIVAGNRSETTRVEADLPGTGPNNSAGNSRSLAASIPVLRTESIVEETGTLLSNDAVDRTLQWSGQARFAVAADARLAQLADTIAQADGAKASAASESTSGSTVTASAAVATTSSADSGTGVRQVATLSLPLQDARWGQQFAERVAMIVNSRASGAELRLNPEHLGPIELSIDVDGGETRVQFAAAHALTRDAIEQHLPRLKEMLSEQGLQLTDANVGDLPQRATRDEAALDPADGFAGEQDDEEGAPDPSASRTVQSIGSGVID
ncbi:MAG: flagellar hook-length control protein FliK, partial [Pseudomonadota bacterium]